MDGCLRISGISGFLGISGDSILHYDNRNLMPQFPISVFVFGVRHDYGVNQR